ncbi:MAG: hypothetical protein Q7S40_24635 [Opitutaceae bacterium]|nr:hypothetical protein [Opitutaceae bacterium]
MSAIKKSTSKATKSPAPATKTAKSSAKKTAAAARAPVATPAEVTPAVVTKLVAAVAAAPKPVSASPVTTTITAVIDVGFGNALYLRGEGPGLSWDKGVLMTCIAPNAWQIALADSTRPYTFKFLVNDFTWSVGPDLTAEPGSDITVTPEF